MTREELATEWGKVLEELDVAREHVDSLLGTTMLPYSVSEALALTIHLAEHCKFYPLGVA